MRLPRSLQSRVALSVGLVLAALWIAAATATALIVRNELNEVFDSALRETAERILPLAVADIIDREEEGVTQRLSAIRAHDEFFTYVVRDDVGRVLVASYAADSNVFPAWTGRGFDETATHRLYSDAALQGTIRITVAEPLAHRRSVAREVQIGLGIPLLFLLPLALTAITLAVRRSLGALRRFQGRIQSRNARDLSPLPTDDLPSEIAPVAATLNHLLDHLREAFEAEQTFAANAAHELRTPLAGAIAQAQRLQVETADANARNRAGEIEATLKRLTRLSERLMQLARAEGGRMTSETPVDLRHIARLVVEDIGRSGSLDRIALSLPDTPVLSLLDPDAFAIICRNLVENALRHGPGDGEVAVTLTADARFIVANDSEIVPLHVLDRLPQRFERAASASTGSGLGLAIVAVIADRAGGKLSLASPRPGRATGFEATVTLPRYIP